MNRYFWSGVSYDERFLAIREITGVVNRFATILNFQRFSDISLSLLLESEESMLNDMHAGLTKILSIEGSIPDLRGSKSDCIVMLNITFAKGTGDLEIEAPEFPE